MKRPITTLFMLESLDGKISTGNSDNLDVIFFCIYGKILSVSDRSE